MGNKGLGTTLVEPFTFERHGYTVHLIDTPGFDGTIHSDATLLADIAACLNQAYVSGIKLNGIIYLHPINSPRIQGSATKCLRIIKKICGPEAVSLLLIGSTMWDKERFEIGKRREEELVESHNFWGDVIDQGVKTFRFFNDPESAFVACDYIIQRGQKMTVALQHQMVNEGKPLNETDAGLELEGDIVHLKEFCRSKIEHARAEAKRAAQTNNDQLALALDTANLELQAKLDASTRAIKVIHGNMDSLHIRSQTALREELQRLKEAEEHEQLLLSEKRTELGRLERRLIELTENLESDKATDGSNSLPPPPYSKGSYNKSTSKIAEVKAVSQKHSKCKKEVEAYESRIAIQKHRKETCLNRLGIGAGVVGAVFQVAAFGLTAAACSIM
jgi:hypothetical protein